MSIKPETLEDFAEFMKVNMRLERRTVRETVANIRKFLEKSNYCVSYETTSAYLQTYLNCKPRTYNAQITSLRRFIRDFMRIPEVIQTFKLAPIDNLGSNVVVPSKEQIKLGFEALEDCHSKAVYLFIAATGLRKSEVLELKKDKIDFKTRTVIPQHFTRVKRSGITFYNAETEAWLNQHLTSYTGKDDLLFSFSDRKWKNLWKNATEAAGIKISPQILRVWFSMEMGEQGVPDRFVDIFQGRAPRSVLAKHYTAKGIERLKAIYEKCTLSIQG